MDQSLEFRRILGCDISIPKWYAHAENELGNRSMMPCEERNECDVTSTKELCVEEFSILHGYIHGFLDATDFLKSLESLDIDFNSKDKIVRCRVCERVAAFGLFSWEDTYIKDS